MEQDPFSRTRMLLGGKAMERLAGARVAVFGIGGVGGYVCEALARSGVGAFDLVDSDRVCLSNLNRQIIATHKTIGQYKVDAMRERIREINPEADVRVYRCFFLPENAADFPFAAYDYVVDAVDTVTAKIELILRAKEKNVPVISSMGAGNKLDGSRFRVADLYQTSVCPLARVMRRELKKRGVTSLKVVYSEETPVDVREEAQEAGLMEPEPGAQGAGFAELEPGPQEAGTVESGPAAQGAGAETRESAPRRRVPGSTAFVPSVAGLLIAGEVVKDLAGRA